MFAFAPMGVTFAKNSRIDEPLANAPEGVYTFRVQGTICHGFGTLLPVESRTPNFGQLYLFYSDMEAQVNMRCCIMGGLDTVIVTTIQRFRSQVTSFVKMFLLADEFIRNQEVLNVRLANHETPGVDFVNP
jgi:hypothetical protein